ncbi:hypothetical protein C8R46DRAFT_1054296 [Mycena filopes]|nr:hypothetical protein C8R46DRAFT_1054296 [Mycena filopes]
MNLRTFAFLVVTLLLVAYYRSVSGALTTADTTKRYVLFKQLQGAGFNNQVQEILLYHHLALLSNRVVYVYQPLIWQPRGKVALPLSGFLSGVTAGTITNAAFDQVCPPTAVKHVSLYRENDGLWQHATDVLSGSDRCIVVDDHILNWTFLASSAIHSIWPSFKHYLVQHFEWSMQILKMVERARPREPYMALHLRRGDFEEHCRGLAASQIGFTTWATLPELTDSIHPPALDSHNYTSILNHCYPSLRRILDAIDSQARANPDIRMLHVLHDGAWDHPTVYLQYHKLEAAVKSPERTLRAGWTGGESDWAVAVDVELAIQARVFIGNGYSSLSSQIVALRLAKEKARTQDITLL